ncbi:MAG: sulfatase-like hydrolase/transferase, partial [Methylococcaceae bacterium]|nr:sulfatase-like hydrolase/transferase [Methylococcaceae bacterium]
MSTFNKNRRRVLGGLSALSLASLTSNWNFATAAEKTDKPNIIFILADDLGVGDLSIYGQTDFQTPNLDQLAQQGLRFTQAYSNSAVCSATRFGLITGRYQYRLRGGLEEPIAGASDTIGLPPEHPTLPSLLKKNGYTTALFGKWHLGSLPNFGPLKSGYDVFFGNYGGAIDYFTHKPGVGDNVKEDLFEGEVSVHKVGYYTDLIADHAVDYIGKQEATKPFFLSLHFTAPHWPWEGPKDEATSGEIKSLFHYDGGNLATYAKMVTSLDAAIGRVLKTLKDRGLDKNTI